MARLFAGKDKMRRFWLENGEWQNDQITVTGDLFHHIRDVCRFSEGDKFELLVDGKAHLVEVEKVDKRALSEESKPGRCP